MLCGRCRNPRRRLLIGAAAALALLPARRVLAQDPPALPTPPALRGVGINYSLWHRSDQWPTGAQAGWGTPSIGDYASNSPAVLATHAAWLASAGVDFIVIDWSNDLGMDIRLPGGPGTQRFIETATLALFQVWRTLAARPQVALMIGCPGDPAAISNGALTAKASEVHDLFAANPVYAGLLQTYLGKPLLLVYVNTPSPWAESLPPWSDPRFTVRFVTGFITQQQTLLGAGGLSRFGYWSWEDREVPTYAAAGGYAECMTVVAAWRGAGTPGRANGATYLGQWAHARAIGPRFVIAGTFNEWWISEQIDVQHSKDVEPSRQLGWSSMTILQQQAALFKAGR